MRWEIELSSHAVRAMRKLDPPVARAIAEGLKRLAENLSNDIAPLPNVTKLVNTDDEYRLRVGDYRIIFTTEVRDPEVEDAEPVGMIGVVLVLRVGHRREVYD